MPYDENIIQGDTVERWEGNDFYVLRYFSRRSGLENETSHLIWAFKDNDIQPNQEAVQLCTELMVNAAQRIEAELRDTRRCRYIVAIPPSSAGPPKQTAERLCAALAAQFVWLTHIPEVLVRTQSIRSSHLTRYGNRASYEDHRRTISYTGKIPELHDETVLMFDDVLTSGNTSCACRYILRDARVSWPVTGIYLGRSQ